MPSTSTKVGHGLAKALGIKLQYRNELGKENLTRGESVFSVSSADTYVEEEPSTMEWIRDVTPDPRHFVQYIIDLFPFVRWITRYNSQWLYGDMIAGITVGAVVVPQSMAYAALALLPPEFGLYSSFMGVLIYWFFATSKDITIGPVAVASTVVGSIVLKAKEKEPDIAPEVIASAVSVIAGCIIIVIGLARCGWIVEFISLTAISAFMTGSALNIAVGQVPGLMGITGFSTREATYKVAINTFKHLGRTKLDAAMGLTALTMLYLIRYGCTYASKRMPNRRKTFFFIATLRTAFVILLYTMISWLVNKNHRAKPRFRILGSVPRGFQHAQVPTLNGRILKTFVGDLPALVIVLLIEHIAIAKSFGRLNNYTIDPSQELVAIGVTNILGPFLGAYPATGSFSRTAIKSKAGVRTPFAGFITAIVVLLAIYALPAVFFYIPNSGLSAVIIHAVGDLITPPNVVYQFWRVSPLEVVIFFAGVLVTFFTNIENGIYTTICISLAVLLFRVVKARGRLLGKVRVHSVIGDHLLDGDGKDGASKKPLTFPQMDAETRDIFLPIDHKDGSNPLVGVRSPHPGIFIYRFSEGFNYPNANHYLDYLTAVIFQQTRRTNPGKYDKLGDRPWNNPGPRRGRQVTTDMGLPTLKAVVLDFSSVNNIDVTSVQILIDVRNQLDQYAAPDTVEWHFACITNRWTKRALASAGFGYPPAPQQEFSRWKPIFSVAEIGGPDSAAAAAEHRVKKVSRSAPHHQHHRNSSTSESNVSSDDTTVYPPQADIIEMPTSHDVPVDNDDDNEEKKERKEETTQRANLGATTTTTTTTDPNGLGKATSNSKVAVVHGINRPLFHIDLASALQAAISNVEWKKEMERADSH